METCERMTTRRLVEIVATASIFLKIAASLSAQEAPPKTLDMSVNGRSMHLWSSGLESRKPGQPVVILEAGLQGTVEMWRPCFQISADLHRNSRTNRSGQGHSDFDGERPTAQKDT
jgi:hypothetical protein